MAFHPLANLSELYDGFSRAVRVQGVPLLLLQDEGQRYVIEDRCPHMEAPLRTGQIGGGKIRCRAHGIAFQLQSGQAEGALSGQLGCLKFYTLAYEGNKVGVELP